jgi:uncharacterized protein YodC (DUF2158 family)
VIRLRKKGAIKVGEVVWLNSGSPALTVTEIKGDFDKTAEVRWIADDNESRYANFPVACLTRIKPKVRP